MERGYEIHRSDAERIIRNHALVKGADIAISKIEAASDSGVELGKTLSGNLIDNVELGNQIRLESDHGISNTTQVVDVYEEDGRVLIKTRTSIYELIKRRPRSVTTAKGSKYTYLPDGRTQRFKEVTQELNEPQDLLLFIPPWDVVKEKAIKLYPDYFDDETTDQQFLRLLMEYIHTIDKTVMVVDGEGAPLNSFTDIEEGVRVFIAFVDKQQNKVDFHIPVEPDPRLGWSTFDTRKYVNENDGLTYNERHIGNKVVDVEY